MSLQSILFRLSAGKNDRRRNQDTPLPEGIHQEINLSYGPCGKHHLLDVYYPQGTTHPLPTIVSIHGGGYVYGNKEIYRLYAMDLARRGFTVVSFNYRLAPRWHFPAPLEDTNRVLTWLCSWDGPVDKNRLFLVGDSAGAQIASQYAAIATNPRYASRFSFVVPPVKIRALGLNCGMYNTSELVSGERKGIILDYLGRKIPSDDPRIGVLEHITAAYPPAHITTACHDFLRENAAPMQEFLTQKGVAARLDCFGSEDRPEIGHVFHVDIRLNEATLCNDLQCRFFLSHL